MEGKCFFFSGSGTAPHRPPNSGHTSYEVVYGLVPNPATADNGGGPSQQELAGGSDSDEEHPAFPESDQAVEA